MNASEFGKEADLASLKMNVDELNINKVKNFQLTLKNIVTFLQEKDLV